MITLTINNRIAVSLSELPPPVVEQLQERLTFPNPVWQENEKRGYSNWKVPETLRLYRLNGGRLFMPRGFIGQALGLLQEAGLTWIIKDQRRLLPEVELQFTGELKDFQCDAADTIYFRDFGTLAAPTGAGKTVIALAIIAARRQPTLIVVHSKELLHQWRERIETFLEIPAAAIGVIGDGQRTVGKKITVALVQTLYKCASEVVPRIGFLVVDECHRCPSRTFTEAVTAFDSAYMLGLSATPWRRDGLSRLIYWHLGSKVYEIDRGALIEDGHILAAEVIFRKTAYEPISDPSEEYSRMLSELTADPERNALIVRDVVQEADGEGVCLVLSDRKAHCETLAGMLAHSGLPVSVLTGDLSMKKRQEIIGAVNGGHVKVLLATGQLIGEGFDCAGLSTLFLATPIRFSGRLLQYLGRVLRPAPGKDKAKVYDYLDVKVGVLVNAARNRARIYQQS
ncbi:DEAD/DEAH box helicase [Desulfobacca acetoxidans]|uniref:Type III restriction protein res subunit n=1 Tax=Desulfobacca acetoxidans (strain ATCC 700848 / DSM 11109 / ASRB2) TaxID=880072 RepID=F2NJ01_DESAR|nr:DEAD/DEAH box helicase [Desulfobacca acetoxidans]AEB07959.1 type III restriction protein res subunit [Desulfobacca acetoxidans DSM 11109]